jgi:glycosyltransferase involved in cell wall biosynthesis
MKNSIVIIPAHNEEKNIQGLVKIIREMGYKVAVIDDCSKDRTFELASAAGAEVIRHTINMGYGVALQTGYKYALAHDYDSIVQLDADGQHDPRYITSLLVPIINREADLCIGSRFSGSENYKPQFLRKVGIVFFRIILKILTGRFIADPTSGFQAMNRKTFSYLSQDTFPDDYPDADIIYMLLRAGARIKEVPVQMNYNKGTSMHNKILNNIYYMLKINLLLLAYCLKEIKKL